MKKILIAFAIISLFGCSTQSPQLQATHEWTASKKRLQLSFVDNNYQCTSNAADVITYENCMESFGYRLIR